MPSRTVRSIALAGAAGAAAAGGLSALASAAGTAPAVVAGAAVTAGVGGAALGLGRAVRHQVATSDRRLVAELRRVSTELGEVRELVRRQSAPDPVLVESVNRLGGEVRLVKRSVENEGRQIEALLMLRALLPAVAPFPVTRGWAASPDLLQVYVTELWRRRPALTVECGSGTSTLYAALTLEAMGAPGRVVALEGDEEYAEQTRRLLDAHGVGHRAEVRFAPIEPVVIDGETYPWYATSAVADLDGVGLLFVDGPIGSSHAQARYPALALLRPRLTPGALVLLDDAAREGEQAVIKHWREEFPELGYRVPPTEKGIAVFEVPAAD